MKRFGAAAFGSRAQPSTRLALVAAGQGHRRRCVSVFYARSPGARCHAV
jgi:hypothetical protein